MKGEWFTQFVAGKIKSLLVEATKTNKFGNKARKAWDKKSDRRIDLKTILRKLSAIAKPNRRSQMQANQRTNGVLT